MQVNDIVDVGKYGKAVIKEYHNARKVLIKFLDEFGYEVWTNSGNLKRKAVKNPYAPIYYGIGILGEVHPVKINGKNTKEIQVWIDMLYRMTKNFKENNPTYNNTIVCDEWIYYHNFKDWLVSQPNYIKWKKGFRWCLDKDILKKNNKTYSPELCTLVPNNVNTLFVKKNANRGEFPIGVSRNHKRFMATYSDPTDENNNQKYVGTYDTPEEAFYAYKVAKEDVIKKVANIEYKKGNITEKCYDAMMNYEVSIDD